MPGQHLDFEVTYSYAPTLDVSSSVCVSGVSLGLDQLRSIVDSVVNQTKAE